MVSYKLISLFFSTANEDKEKRLRAFLSCMRCEDIQSLLIPATVPQHSIILACVLRYIMTATKIPVFQKPELDAFLVTAFSPEIGNHKYLTEMTLDYVTPRGVQLATMFMQVRRLLYWFSLSALPTKRPKFEPYQSTCLLNATNHIFTHLCQ